VNIALDLDGTLFYNTAAQDIAKKHGYEVTDYYLELLPGDVKQEIMAFYSDTKKMENLKPMCSKGFLRKIKNDGHNVGIVTARGIEGGMKEATKKMVAKSYDITPIAFTGGFNKLDYFIDNKTNIVIDDSPYTIGDAINIGIEHCVLVVNENTPYNTDSMLSQLIMLASLIGVSFHVCKTPEEYLYG